MCSRFPQFLLNCQLWIGEARGSWKITAELHRCCTSALGSVGGSYGGLADFLRTWPPEHSKLCWQASSQVEPNRWNTAGEGYDPDDPVVVAALASVSAVLAKLGPLVWEASAVLDEQTDSREELLRALEEGARHRFADWPVQAVPKVAAGVYTIWDHDRSFTWGWPVAGSRPSTLTPRTSR